MTPHANTLNDENLGVHGRFYLLYETSLYQNACSPRPLINAYNDIRHRRQHPQNLASNSAWGALRDDAEQHLDWRNAAEQHNMV